MGLNESRISGRVGSFTDLPGRAFWEVQVRSRKTAITVKVTAPAIAHGSLHVADPGSGGLLQPLVR
jgi:hypothetical protein